MEQSALILYTRENCPLCGKAKHVLEEVKKEFNMAYTEIDIHSDGALLERFGLMIPVIEWKGTIIQYGKVDKSTILTHLEK